MIDSEESHLQETIDADVLRDATVFNVILLDGMGQEQSSYEKSVLVDNPYSTDPTRFLPREQLMDLNRFYDVAAQIIEDAQDRAGVVTTEKVKLVQEYQPERFYSLGDEVISVRVLRREPAKMNRTATGRPQRASRFSHEVRSSSFPNNTVIVESRPIDHKIEFSCWAKTATLANKRALWLEKLFIQHSWAFTVQGVDRFYWEDRGPDTLWKHGEQRLHQRALTFFVRFHEFEAFIVPNINQINFKVSTST